MRGRDSLAPLFDNLNNYETTVHFNGQSSVQLHDNRASGVSYCLAHHISHRERKCSLMIASIRYLDTFVKQDGALYFAERKLLVDWMETRQLSAATV